MDELVVRLYREVDDVVACRVMFEQGKALAHLFADRKAFTEVWLRKVLLARLLINLMRIADPASRDRICLDRVFSLLDGREASDTANALIETARSQWASLRDHPSMPKLRNHRNFQIAHSIPEPFEPALIEDLLEISRQTEDIVSKIANASGIVAMDFGPSVRVWSDRADAFWKRLAGLTA